jgi:hypothetical protein
MSAISVLNKENKPNMMKKQDLDLAFVGAYEYPFSSFELSSCQHLVTSGT